MMLKETCTESVSRDKERMLRYKGFAVAFSYPEKEELRRDYDRLFRAKEIWLYTTEHLAKNEFQRSNYLADIMGFYRAFGVEPDRDRPDSLSAELEFMHYLIFKLIHAGEGKDAKDKAYVCIDAQKKFFSEHLYPAAKKISKAICKQSEKGFYKDMASEMLEFLESEREDLRAKSVE